MKLELALPARTLRLLALALLAGCASQPQRAAVDRATEDLLERLDQNRPEIRKARGEDRTRTAVHADRERGLHHDVLVALQDQAPGLLVVATGKESQVMLERAADQIGDEYWQGDGIAHLGNILQAQLFIVADAHYGDEGHVDVDMQIYDLASQSSVGVGEGSSYGKWERAGSWGFFGLRCLAVPFVAIYDIGRTSIDYAFRDEKKPTFLGAMGRSLLAIVYSPVAIFTSDYGHTKALFRENEPSAG